MTLREPKVGDVIWKSIGSPCPKKFKIISGPNDDGVFVVEPSEHDSLKGKAPTYNTYLRQKDRAGVLNDVAITSCWCFEDDVESMRTETDKMIASLRV